jgi:hypothetical protein
MNALIKTRDVLVPDLAGKDDILRCHNCKKPHAEFSVPYLWFPELSGNRMRQTVEVYLYSRCCGAQAHSEPVAAAVTYLHAVKDNLRLMCNLINQHLLAGRTQPEWLTRRWEEWEERFVRPTRD